MKAKNRLTPAEATVVVSEWKRPKGERPTQQELALRFNVAPVTIRRALAEEGLVDLAGYKTVKETAIIEFLKAQGLNDLSKLTNFVVKARTGNRAK